MGEGSRGDGDQHAKDELRNGCEKFLVHDFLSTNNQATPDYRSVDHERKVLTFHVRSAKAPCRKLSELFDS